ncbi:hypothetical protein A3J78_00080 [Candidatus Beckwithbacteria bacterium RBG_13_35_6]|uniref:Type II toxin-antitoxin system mRNA interferase toxin, RelE/StbE family n=1 Tax=Candidatus Beckwithbacteria bacterium RBG_13_35_6 TaxID=1797456 RepID=A0A1F5DHC3_9BACT|nr:MAG: hypothetical protein A3J78_00080 [Candidatus Beckwithbacteria bacterium RBG_13_35_6]
MKVYFSHKFTSQYKLLKKRDPKMAKKLQKRIAIFIKNPYHPILKTHSLTGKLREKWAFWISWDLRIVFELINKSSVRFLAVGKHDQVYK